MGLIRLLAGLLGLALAIAGTVAAIAAFYSLKDGNTSAWLSGSLGALAAVAGAWLMLRAPRF